jgi:outer membrane protein TolC
LIKLDACQVYYFLESAGRFALVAAFSKLLVFLILTSLVAFGTNALPGIAVERDVNTTGLRYQPIGPKQTLTLGEAVDVALKNFPSIPSARFKLRAALADVTLARTQYLPNLNLDVQELRTTHNVVSSTIMPPLNGFDVIPNQSGTVGASSAMKSVFVTNQGINLSYLVYDFGQRHANVELAQADAKLARANLRLTQLDVAFAAADAYLSAVAAKETIISAQATLDRMQAAAVTVHTLVDQGLRPGVDAARADYDVSQAKIGLIKAGRATRLAQVDLAERLGIASSDVEVVPEPLVRGPKKMVAFGAVNLDTHPLALVRSSTVDTWAAKVHLLDRTWYPHLWFDSAIWGKGTGDQGGAPPALAGVVPQIANYMAGFSMSFPVMDIFAIKAKKRSAYNMERSERSNLDLAIQILEQKDARARVLLEENRRVAGETPRLVQSAKENEIKVLERYRQGLTNMVAVAEAERILAEAEVEDAIAQIEVWRSILALGYVQGDLKPFLSLVAAAGGSAR